MGAIFGMASGRLIVCSGYLIGRCGIRQAMLVKQSRRGLRNPFSAQKTGQQRVENKRIGNNAADKAAPQMPVAC